MKWFAGLVLLMLLGTSGAMVGAFAYTVAGSHGEKWAWIFAGASVALLAIECLAGPLAARACAARKYGQAGLYLAALAVTGATVFSLDIGFTSTVFADFRAQRGDSSRITALAATVRRPSGMVRVDLDLLEGQHKGISAKWCGSPNVNLKDACTKWMALRSELIAADTSEANPERTGDADGRAALLSRITPFHADTWADVLVLLMACALSLGRVAASCALGDVKQPTGAVVPLKKRELFATPRNSQEIPVFQRDPVGVPPPGTSVQGQEPADRVKAVLVQRPRQARPGGRFTVGFISQRDLAEASKVSVRQTRKALSGMVARGEIFLNPTRHGTEIELAA
jgi:hypothetical protein